LPSRFLPPGQQTESAGIDEGLVGHVARAQHSTGNGIRTGPSGWRGWRARRAPFRSADSHPGFWQAHRGTQVHVKRPGSPQHLAAAREQGMRRPVWVKAHRFSRLVNLPSASGIVPLKRLPVKFLQNSASMISGQAAVQGCNMLGCAQCLEAGKAAHGIRQRASNGVLSQIPATTKSITSRR
jgi:hypothetical protein